MGTTDIITAATKKELNEKIRDWKRTMREMGWDIRWVREPKKAEDGTWGVEVSAHT